MDSQWPVRSSGGVISINGDTTPAQLIVGGTNITVTTVAGTTTVSGTGSGNVVGPGSATDNAIVRFDGTTGKLIKNSGTTISNTDVVSFAAGAVGSPTLTFGADSTTGWYRAGSNDWSFSNAGTRQFSLGNSGVVVYGGGSTLTIAGIANGWSLQGPTTSGFNQMRFQSNSSDGGVTFVIESVNSGTSWSFYIVGTGDEKFLGSWRSGNTGNFPVTYGAFDTVVLGNTNETALRSGTVMILQKPDDTNIGGTTSANATTSITGSGTKFPVRIGLGDRVSLSSSAGTYATVKTLVSNTSMTVDANLGNGTSQTINVKHSPFLVTNSDNSTVYFLINDQGRVLIGNSITYGGPQVEFDLQGTARVSTLTASQLVATDSSKNLVSIPKLTFVAISSNVTLTDNSINFVDTSTARSLALPNPATMTGTICLKDVIGTCNANNITVTRFGSEKIEGVAASKVFVTDWGSWTLASNGTDWFLI